MKPQFEHNCDKCVFVGNFTDSSGRPVDAYCCGYGSDTTLTVRHSSEPADYGSLPLVSVCEDHVLFNQVIDALPEGHRYEIAKEYKYSSLFQLLVDLSTEKAEITNLDIAFVIDQIRMIMLFNHRMEENNEKAQRKALAFLELAQLELG